MTVVEQIVCNIAHEFIYNHWNRIDKGKCEITETKLEFLDLIEKCVYTAVWSITEIAYWGMDKNYLDKIFIERNGKSNIIKVGEKYIKVYNDSIIKPHKISFTEKNRKLIEYWS